MTASTKKTRPVPLAPRPAVAPAAEVHPADADLYWEDKVADSLGLARELFRLLREKHLQCLEHWHLRQGSVVLTARGLEEITRLTQLDNPLAATAPSPASPAPGPVEPIPGPPARGEFLVALVPINRRLLICRRAIDTPPNMIVRVSSNENFIPGMKVPVIESGTCWQVFGRLPRRKGRW